MNKSKWKKKNKFRFSLRTRTLYIVHKSFFFIYLWQKLIFMSLHLSHIELNFIIVVIGKLKKLVVNNSFYSPFTILSDFYGNLNINYFVYNFNSFYFLIFTTTISAQLHRFHTFLIKIKTQHNSCTMYDFF